MNRKCRLFNMSKGIIVACDVMDEDALKKIVKETNTVKGIAGYKVGSILGLKYGLKNIGHIVADLTDLPIIYDHQKAGTDIPRMGQKIVTVCKVAGISLHSLIGFKSQALEWLLSEMTTYESKIIQDYLENPGKFQRPSIIKELTRKAMQHG